MIAELLALITMVNLFQVFLILAGGFLVVACGIVFIKYFRFIMGYTVLFLFLGIAIYAGSKVWPLP